MFRAGAARANYLALGRPDIAYAAKELCRRRSAPPAMDFAALRRLARYLAAPRQVYYSDWQEALEIDVLAATDWAGCVATLQPGGARLAVVR